LSLRSVKTRRFNSLSHQKFIQVIAVALLSGCFWCGSLRGGTWS
jgi:hypothetical protein